MNYSMTLPQKLVAAAAHPDQWDVRGLMMDAADMLVEHCGDLFEPEDDDDDDEEHDRLIADIVARGNRREVVPGWTLEEILQRES